MDTIDLLNVWNCIFKYLKGDCHGNTAVPPVTTPTSDVTGLWETPVHKQETEIKMNSLVKLNYVSFPDTLMFSFLHMEVLSLTWCRSPSARSQIKNRFSSVIHTDKENDLKVQHIVLEPRVLPGKYLDAASQVCN